MRCRWYVYLAVVLLVPACTAARQGPVRTAPTDRPTEEGLRPRAVELWTARLKEDWATVFRFEEPARRKSMVEADFIAFCQQKEPFRIEAFELGRVQVQPPLGWVEVQCDSSIRQFPNIPARHAQRWEKWRITDQRWYPVPAGERDQYPEPPAHRDQAEETRLRARFDAAWEARRARDWQRLHEFVDPHDRAEVTLAALTEDESRTECLSCVVQWVEVIGDRGRVQAVYTVKSTDPSMTKMLPETPTVTELWIKYENEWYRDLPGSK